MSRHSGQTSSKLYFHSDELQLSVLTQLNKALIHEISTFKNAQYQHQEEIKLLLNTAKQLKYHYFAVASQILGIVSLSYLIDIYEAQLTKGSIHFNSDSFNTKYVSLICDTFFNPLSDTLLGFLNGVWTELQPSGRAATFRKSVFETLKRVAPALNTAALQ